MNKVIIATDSSAYLPKEYVDKYQIPVLPLTVNWEGKSYYDGIDIQAEEFYQQLGQSKSMATTSQVTVGQFLEVFGKLLDAGNQVLYLGISSGISATINSALQAKAELGDPENLIVMDSQFVSMALGLMVLEVAKAAENGASLQECYQLAQDAVGRIGVFFTVDTLEYLHRGGRIAPSPALMRVAGRWACRRAVSA